MRLTVPVLAALACLAGAALAQPRSAPGRAEAEAHIARCDGAAQHLSAARLTDLQSSFSAALPAAREILARHHVEARFTDGGRTARVELHLQGLRNLEMPDGRPATVYLDQVDGARILQHPASRHPALWEVDEATVAAASRAYDVRYADLNDPNSQPFLEGEAPPELAGYEVVGLYTDRYSAFAGLVLQSRPQAGRPVHRIYAIAGTHVFDHTDLRSWGSGLTFGRGQFVSNGALRMIADAARYAEDLQHGGEVFVTGQSQGGLTAQGAGYMLQARLDAGGRAHHLAHVVSWGGVGAREIIALTIAHWRDGEVRGFPSEVEQHWAITDPNQPDAAETWNAITQRWAAVPAGAEAAHLDDVASRMRAVGYFFEIDLFARAGSFLGQTFAFPTALILPDACDATVAELVVGSTGGSFGVRLESHFLRGYQRAVARGAIAVARPAVPEKWQWATNLIPTFEAVGDVWMETVYFNGVATTPANWARCRSAATWRTARNATCSFDWWPGCGPEADGQANWCLAREAPAGFVAHPLR
jgi:hypothetical protein